MGMEKDECDVADFLVVMYEELKTHSDTPEFDTAAEGQKKRMLSRNFVEIINTITVKYQLGASQMIKEQQDARRYAAVKINDTTAFGRALMEGEVRRVELAVQVEDMVFDYFGIIAVQYEMANGEYGKDVKFQTDKLVTQNKLAKEIIKTNAKDDTLTDDQVKELSKRISEFTMTLMKGLGTTDPKTGKTLFDPQAASEKGFDIMLQMEKDKFFM